MKKWIQAFYAAVLVLIFWLEDHSRMARRFLVPFHIWTRKKFYQYDAEGA
jgi:tryptophan-rich sensory protein